MVIPSVARDLVGRAARHPAFQVPRYARDDAGIECAAMNLDKKSLLAFAERERSAFERALEEFVEIPTVSSEPERKGDIRRCADRAASLIREFGGQAEVLETAGNPLVHGTFSSGAVA